MQKPNADDSSRLFVIGLDPKLKSSTRQLIGSICKLSETKFKRKDRGYHTQFHIVELGQEIHIDIMVVDGRNDQAALKSWIELAASNSLPLISIGVEPLNTDVEIYRAIHPSRLGVALLRTLNELAELVISPASHVLVIDDSQLIREYMSMILEPYNIRVSFAEDGVSGVYKAKARPFDLIFLDVMLPGMDGYSICKAIKQDPCTADTPVIMLTSKTSPFNKVKGAMSGCNRYLTKPIDEKKVISVIEEFKGCRQQTADDKLNATAAYIKKGV